MSKSNTEELLGLVWGLCAYQAYDHGHPVLGAICIFSLTVCMIASIYYAFKETSL